MQGGHGNAGWKRHRWSSVIRYGWEIGKTGFVPVNPRDERAINVGDLSMGLDRLVEEGRAKQAGNKFEINLGEMGFTKLLGTGRITRPIRVVVAECSERAANKISEAGGEVVLPKSAEPSEKS